MKKSTVSILVITAIALGVYIFPQGSEQITIKSSPLEKTAIKQPIANNQVIANKSPQPAIETTKFNQQITAPLSLPMSPVRANMIEPADHKSPISTPQAHGHEHQTHQHGNRNPDFGVPRPPGEPKN